jgi:hypothetical protein
MVAPSFNSHGTSPLDLFYRRTKPVIGIELEGQRDGFVSSYTTLDRIRGVVTVTADYDMRFDDISITFEGMVVTCAPSSVALAHGSIKDLLG